MKLFSSKPLSVDRIVSSSTPAIQEKEVPNIYNATLVKELLSFKRSLPVNQIVLFDKRLELEILDDYLYQT